MDINFGAARDLCGLSAKLMLGTALGGLALAPLPAFAQNETITVTGTSIRGERPTGSNLITVDRALIENSGAQSTAQLLVNIPGLNNFGSAAQGGQNSSDQAGTQAPTIHSLGNSASNGTLILINGRRIPLSGLTHSLADPSIIPAAALQRVEVLPDGASAIYGSDAVAGVLNFITRKDYDGWESGIQSGMADKYQSFTASQLFGHSWDGGSLVAAYNYVSRSELATRSRDFETPRQDLRLGVLANPTAFAPAISATPPTGFLATTPAAGNGTTGPFGATVPYPSAGGNFQNFNCPIAAQRNASGTNTTSFLYPYTAATGVNNANTTPGNGVCDATRYTTDLPSETRNVGLVSVRQALNDVLSVTLDLVYSSRVGASRDARGVLTNITVFGPTATGANAPPVGTFQINPFYTVGTTGLSTRAVQISYDLNELLANFPQASNKTGDTTAFATLGLDADLGGGWAANIGTTLGNSYAFTRRSNVGCVSCAILALNGTTNNAGSANSTPSSSAIIDPYGLGTTTSGTRALTTANALDVWTPASSNRTSDAVKRSLVSAMANMTGLQGINDVSFKVDGPLFDVPAGPLKTAFGAEYTQYTMAQRNVGSAGNNLSAPFGPSSISAPSVNLTYSRTVYSAFMEILVPLISSDMGIPLINKFTLDMSGRYDHYSDMGQTKNPKVGFEWDIIDGLMARGSYGSSFTAPALSSIGTPGTGVSSETSVNAGGFSTTAPFSNGIVPFSNATLNGGAGVSGTFAGNAADCAAAGSQPTDANGNVLTVAPYTGAVGCKINTTNNPGIQYGSGGSPLTRPEVGTTYSLGLDVNFGSIIDVLEGLSASVTYYQAKYAGLVTSIGLQTNLPGLTYLAPPGGWSPTDPFIVDRLAGQPVSLTLPSRIWSFFDGRQTNAYTIWVNGLDYSVNYRMETDIGTWTANISGNEILRFTQKNGITPTLLDIKNGKNSGRFVANEMTWRTTLGWQMDPFTVNLSGNFQSPFVAAVSTFPYNLTAGTDPRHPASGLQKVGALFTLDLNASYTLPSDWLEGTTVNLSISNLLDTDPPFQNNAAGFSTGSQLGRLVTVGVRKKW